MNGCVVEAVAAVSNERDSKIAYTSIGVQCKNQKRRQRNGYRIGSNMFP